MAGEIVVVGAGPYGLSVAAHLHARGARARVFGVPMGSWHDHMPAGMFLKSTPSASNLDAPSAGTELADYCRTMGLPVLDEHMDPVPIELFVDYGRWFATHLGLNVEDASVTGIVRKGREFEVALSDGEVIRTRCVVVASGHVAHSFIPPEVAALSPDGPSPDGLFSHTSDHSTLANFAGKRVAVIGAGQSALESAALLHEAGAEPMILVRGTGVKWGGAENPNPPRFSNLRAPASGLGPGWRHRALTDVPFLVRYLPPSARSYLLANILGPFGAWWLHDRVEGLIDIQVGTRITRAEATDDGRVRLELGTSDGGVGKLDVDHVLTATGYRVDVGRIEFLDRPLIQALRTVPGTTAPVLNAGFESSAPGLYFAGLASAMTFGPVMRFVYGTHFTAARLANAAVKSAAS